METSLGTFEIPIPTTLRLLINCGTLNLYSGGVENEQTTFALHGLDKRPEFNMMRVKKMYGNVVELLPPGSQHWSMHC